MAAILEGAGGSEADCLLRNESYAHKSSPEKEELAAKYKEQANEHFKSKCYTRRRHLGRAHGRAGTCGVRCPRSSSQHLWFAFAEQEFNAAIELYSKAIEADPYKAVYYGNRSFAYLKTECFGYALKDASKAIELDRTYVKVRLCSRTLCG